MITWNKILGMVLIGYYFKLPLHYELLSFNISRELL